MNRLNTAKRAQVISALVEGVSINATCRMTGVAKHRAAFAKRIRQLSMLTWNEIIQAGRHGFGSEHNDRSSLIPKIPAHVTDDVGFIAIRFSGLKPMAGYQSKGTFHIIWFDRDMKGVYNHG